MRRYGLLLIGFLAITTFMQFSSAAQIKAVKGKKVLVDMQADTFKVNDILKIESTSGKTVGLIKVIKTKGVLAEGVLKGKAEKGLTVSLRPPKSGSKTSSESTSKSSSEKPKSGKSSFGLMVGYNSTSAEVKLATALSPTVSLSGSGFSLKGLMDYPLFSWLNFRALAGLEQFNVGGASNTEPNGCGGECTAEINYLTFDMWGRYVMGSGGFRAWAGIGFELMFPMSKSATVLNEKSITNTSTSPFAVGGGFDWYTSETFYIPVQVEYVPYPSTNDVKASAIAARVGIASTF